MHDYVTRSDLQVHADLATFIEREALPGTGIGDLVFWKALAALVGEFGVENRRLLEARAALQRRIDDWHITNRKSGFAPETYRAFLSEIGYLEPETEDFTIETAELDPEIAAMPGPQLVVPVTNARYALNAVNARWGSLYDSLYGTDAMGDAPETSDYDPARGDRVIAWTKTFLDEAVPLDGASHADIAEYRIARGRLQAVLADETGTVGLRDPEQFAGHVGDAAAPEQVLLVNHGLHLILKVDRSDRVGAQHAAGIADVILEAAITTIIDCEDSVVAVDGPDKTAAYRNWLGLMRGDLREMVMKDGRTFLRELAGNRVFQAPRRGQVTLRGRSLMLVRNVGLLMTTPAVRDATGEEIFEGILDALCTVTIALHDLTNTRLPKNSAAGSIYVVKPKLHGSEEVAFTERLFTRVEQLLGLAPDTVKLGIMDEERRTSVNLKACIRAAKSRVAFINTGFLDRTGDEIRTSTEAGPMVRKGEMRQTAWYLAYEDRNVDIGLACGLKGRAQIGKGMWTMPDRMAEMLRTKIAHPEAGATTAWVPSPTAAVLHATQYHRVDVLARQAEIAEAGPRATLEELLAIPIGDPSRLSAEEIEAELDNNAQGILGYAVRWVDHGIGCSKVPDTDDVGLMEDRATCRISAQALANWLHQGVVSEREVALAMQRMAAKVDLQNADDPTYRPMAPDFDGFAYRAAVELVFRGSDQPSGYTEPLLHRFRRDVKAEVVPQVAVS